MDVDESSEVLAPVAPWGKVGTLGEDASGLVPIPTVPTYLYRVEYGVRVPYGVHTPTLNVSTVSMPTFPVES